LIKLESPAILTLPIRSQ